MSRDFSHHIELDLIRTLHPDFRGGKGFWQILNQFIHPFSRAGQDLQKPAGGVQGIVKSEIPVFEEHMSAHLSGQLGVFLLHFLLDQRMPGAPHDGVAPAFPDIVIHDHGALDFGNKSGPGFAGQNLPGIDHHELVTVDHLAV